MENQLTIRTEQTPGVFTTETAFVAAQRMAKALCSSKLVPEAYQGESNIGSALIALEISQRLNSSPLMVMQNLHIIHGKPSWSAKFVISALISCGRFSPLRFELKPLGKIKFGQDTIENVSCIALAYDKATGDKLESPEVTIEMAVKEGWYGKNGSKWRTMPELMLRYRAASFFGSFYAPDVLMGMPTSEELRDIAPTMRKTKPIDIESAFEQEPVAEKQPEITEAVIEPETTETETDIFE